MLTKKNVAANYMEYEAGRKVSNYTQYSYLLETKSQYKEAAPNPSVKIWYFVE